MIPDRIEALFDFIDFLDANKQEYINKYIPLCEEIGRLDSQKSGLNPSSNYIDKQKYDALKKEISEKFEPIHQQVYLPFVNKLIELKIWSGDDAYASIWNNNSAAIIDFKEHFEIVDIEKVMAYKHKYLNFRKETNSNFLSLHMMLNSLDQIYKTLFDFFKDTPENEFEHFEATIIEVDSIENMAEQLTTARRGNQIFSLPLDSLLNYQNIRKYYPELYQTPPTIKNEFIMGNKIQVRDIIGHGTVLNSGNDVNIHAAVNVSKGNLDSLKQQLSKHGIEEEDIQELSEILQTEEPNTVNSTLGEKSNNWILKIAGKALSGAGKIATGISSNILATLIRQYYGI